MVALLSAARHSFSARWYAPCLVAGSSGAGFRAAWRLDHLGALCQPMITYETNAAWAVLHDCNCSMRMQASLSMVYDRGNGQHWRVPADEPLPDLSLDQQAEFASALIFLDPGYTRFGDRLDVRIQPTTSGFDSRQPRQCAWQPLLSALGLLLSTVITPGWRPSRRDELRHISSSFFNRHSYPAVAEDARSRSDGYYWICNLNPFTHTVELGGDRLYLQFNGQSLCWSA